MSTKYFSKNVGKACAIGSREIGDWPGSQRKWFLVLRVPYLLKQCPEHRKSEPHAPDLL